ncbi:Protein of unknown function CpeS/Ycf58 [[Leptolyngbya] sp. PCC 7376]|uniref:phycobiliprotein lyase n=1 Tax=[Leptolyngbya] sp. PCC 7376 TaxID=111781 RepID=UPI00029F14EB|nr:phycobiliprotein lyase [[Leptolyngbya] sp. PCC 7376]AFY36909.1 Protein of unknown function CpeS/Ycf58 [[Leptolyngbya] sp. PCC 7376]
MDIEKFVESSLGQWRSQRSAHHLAFGHFEQVTSTINIEPLPKENPDVIALCKTYDIDPEVTATPFRMSWEGESDWDDDETFSGTTILIPIPDTTDSQKGKLLRDQGYAETISSAGEYYFDQDGAFVLKTTYDRAAAEERIWFANPNFRMRVSLIKTSAGSGVVTASFSSEIREEATA